ncbi:hypothetical protein Nepgr_030876 [Nepenthes gracilis]|uniref:Uncharacterized protein n=1 Tax=Nepenthes gracilis TaxID=150966 RepID=A0AAD3THD6_NEPGR|nr:hypothetical protein Nepgr_030876 [Nepenthes gracilis]
MLVGSPPVDADVLLALNEWDTAAFAPGWVLALSGGGPVRWASSTGTAWMTADGFGCVVLSGGKSFAAIFEADLVILKWMVLCSLAIYSHSVGGILELDALLQWLNAEIMR